MTNLIKKSWTVFTVQFAIKSSNFFLNPKRNFTGTLKNKTTKIIDVQLQNSTTCPNVMIHTLFFHFRTLMIVGILTNLSVCWVVVRNSQARTARNLFIINMAFSDLTVCCITMPATVMKLINHTWKYGDLLCRLTRYIFIMNYRFLTIETNSKALYIFRCFLTQPHQ